MLCLEAELGQLSAASSGVLAQKQCAYNREFHT